jgi:hypothetical protein
MSIVVKGISLLLGSGAATPPSRERRLAIREELTECEAFKWAD